MTANNQVILIGRVGNDIAQDKRRLPNGGVVAELRLAVNRPTKGPDGNPITDWFTCKFWDQQAERLLERVSKGDLVSVTGSLRVDSWQKEGHKRSSVFVHGESFERNSSPGPRQEYSHNGSAPHSRPQSEVPASRVLQTALAPSFTKEDYQYPGHHLRQDYYPLETKPVSDPEALEARSRQCKHCGGIFSAREHGAHLANCDLGPSRR